MDSIAASSSRAAEADRPAGRPTASASSARAAPPAPSARKASSGQTPAAEKTVPSVTSDAQCAVSPLTARIVAFVTGIPPPLAPRLPFAQPYGSCTPLRPAA